MWPLQVFRTEDVPVWLEGIITREIREWVGKWQRLGDVKRICNTGQRPFHDQKHKKIPTEVRWRTWLGGGNFFNPKDCDSDTSQSLRKLSVDLQHDWAVTQGHSDRVLQVSFLLAGSFLQQELLVPENTVHKAVTGQGKSLCGLLQHKPCNNDHYFWNTVKTNIGALKLFTFSVRMVYAAMSSSESEQELCPG